MSGYGGAHLSVAFALGAALPTPFLGRVDAIDTADHTWALLDNAPAAAPATRLLDVTDRSEGDVRGGDALVYLDLLPTRSDHAFERF